MNPKRRQRGFTLVTALFLIAVVAVVGAVASRIGVDSHINSARDIQAARAYYAARSALEYAMLSIEADPTRSCPAAPGPIEGFVVNIDLCLFGDIDEAGASYRVFDLQVSAAAGSRAAATLARRTLRSVVRIDAP